MPYMTRRGRLWLARETATYGTAATGAASTMLGSQYGPLSGMTTTTLGAQASTPGVLMPTIQREIDSQFFRHFSPANTGRKFEDVVGVPARRQTTGQFTVEVMPDSFGLLLLLANGTDVVTPTGSSTTTGAGNTANSTTLTVATGLPALTDGQLVFISDGANSEYVQVNGNQGINQLAVPIKGGAGSGAGLKFTHAAGVTVQVGPWTHVITPAAGSVGSMQAEDNYGGHASSLLYKGMLIDSLELVAPIENETDVLHSVVKIIGMAPSSASVAASAAGTLPVEEVPVAAGNSVAVVATGATDATIYVPDFRATLTNNAKLGKASSSSPDPYAGISTLAHLRGHCDTVFESYGVFADHATNKEWSPATFTWTWPAASMPAGGSGTKVAPTLQLTIQRMNLANLGKPTSKEDMVHLPIDEWRATDADFATPWTWTLKNNVALY